MCLCSNLSFVFKPPCHVMLALHLIEGKLFGKGKKSCLLIRCNSVVVTDFRLWETLESTMRFREEKTKAGESCQELFVRLRELARIPPTEHTVETVLEVIVLEQFLLMITSEIRVWVWERDRKSAAEAPRLAEVYMSARQDQRAFSNANTVAAA
uniref:SCAN box domain-containing protein n=1 Tax=Salmo trutta TaxID=8032 RepID=A0A673ZY11_SALTR